MGQTRRIANLMLSRVAWTVETPPLNSVKYYVSIGLASTVLSTTAALPYLHVYYATYNGRENMSFFSSMIHYLLVVISTSN
jgi:hypothetical protein